jgi:hypothetical protein
VIESIRALLAGHAPGSNASIAAIWCVGILAVSVIGSTFAFRWRTAS